MTDRPAIDANFEAFYAERAGALTYPTEFVVRIFLSRYPELSLAKPAPGANVLDVAFGDGRNTRFLSEQGFRVSGVEITQGIVDQTAARLAAIGVVADLRVGRNSHLPFPDEAFDLILACACCYYCDDGETLHNNLEEYSRVLKPGGVLVASVADQSSYIFDGAERLPDGSFRITADPYGNRVGYRLHGFSDRTELEGYFSRHFQDFSFGHSRNDYFGIHEKLFWVVCSKPVAET